MQLINAWPHNTLKHLHPTCTHGLNPFAPERWTPTCRICHTSHYAGIKGHLLKGSGCPPSWLAKYVAKCLDPSYVFEHPPTNNCCRHHQLHQHELAPWSLGPLVAAVAEQLKLRTRPSRSSRDHHPSHLTLGWDHVSYCQILGGVPSFIGETETNEGIV